MHERDWIKFLVRGIGKEIAIAQLNCPALLAHFGAENDKVYLHHKYAIKAVVTHLLRPKDLALIFDVVEFGIALDDRPRHVTFLHETEIGWMQVTIKCALASQRLYVSTVYKTNKVEVARKQRKYPILRTLKRAA